MQLWVTYERLADSCKTGFDFTENGWMADDSVILSKSFHSSLLSKGNYFIPEKKHHSFGELGPFCFSIKEGPTLRPCLFSACDNLPIPITISAAALARSGFG